MFTDILTGIVSFSTFSNLSLVFFGTFCGIIIGALPGLSTTMGIALFVPFTFSMDPLSGLAMLGGLYNGSVYGGSISAILLRTPGTAASCATIFDGYPMTQKGEAGKALGTAVLASCIGGVFGVIVLLTVAPPLAQFALSFGSPEYFLIAILGLTVIITLSEDNLLKGLIVGLLGVLAATVGFDPIEGVPRFTFGYPDLYDGIPFVPALIGLFSMAEVIRLVAKARINDEALTSRLGKLMPSWAEIMSIKRTILRSSIIGTIVGILPGAGADIASFVGYSEAKRKSKTPELFGTGIIEGVAASETANNAVVGGSLVPLLTLGVPGNSASAVLLGGLLIHGLNPGPLLFNNHTDIVYGFMVSLLFANIAVIFLGFIGLRVFPHILKVPKKILIPMIVVLSVTGSYSVSNSYSAVIVMLFFGLIGFVLEHFHFPLAPMVLGIILGPMAEDALSQSLLMSRGSYGIFIARPICVALLILIGASVFYSMLNILCKRKRRVRHEA